MLKITDNRFQAKCTTCTRSSPVCAERIDEARVTIKELGWAEGIGGDWHCPVCTTRSTAKRKPYSAP